MIGKEKQNDHLDQGNTVPSPVTNGHFLDFDPEKLETHVHAFRTAAPPHHTMKHMSIHIAFKSFGKYATYQTLFVARNMKTLLTLVR